MKKTRIFTLGLAALLASGSGCIQDLETLPLDRDEVVAGTVYDSKEAYLSVLAKVYAGLAVSGQQGPAGMPDISGIDEGFSTYIRQYWKAQESTTDEAMIAWQDGNLRDYHDMDWTSANEFVTAMYNRIYYQIALVNEFIREASDAKLDERGFSAADKAEIARYRSEARVIRALSYWHALDMFRNVPFVTDQNAVGAFFPEQTNAAELFTYIESELKAVESELAEASATPYARASKAVAQMILAKLYLNAEVYIGQPKYAECLAECDKIINSGAFSLDPDYAHVFMADNNTSPEIIFPVAFDGMRTQTWGGMTFVIHAAIGGDMVSSDFGMDAGWGGLRTTSAFVGKFDDVTGETDSRAKFFTDGQSLEIETISEFTQGYAITKYTNMTSAGEPGSNLTFPDTDFPMFRLADVHLMYAEAHLRGGGGDAGRALSLVNALRERAYGDQSGNIAAGELTLDFILDERSRELYWECHRRTDLVRFNQFTTDAYLWPWKGGVASGTAVDAKYEIFPLPASDVGANPNLTQNPGY